MLRFTHLNTIFKYSNHKINNTLKMEINFKYNKQLGIVFPKLHNKSIKGDNGRIGIIGGSFQFTGAPFYAAISALKTGADLSHIFCSYSSAVAIKSYSPQIIVHPVFKSYQQLIADKVNPENLDQIYNQWVQKIKIWQKAIDGWIIGPGLGRDQSMTAFFPKLIKGLDKKLMIFDADAIFHLCQNPLLIQHLKDSKVIITPNRRQRVHLFKLLDFSIDKIQQQLEKHQITSSQYCEQIIQFDKRQFKQLPVSLFIKDQKDLILMKNSQFGYNIHTQGCNKRCGGIGDIISGVLTVCTLWNEQYGPIIASQIVKLAAKKAFQIEGRSMTAPTVISVLYKAVKQIQDYYTKLDGN